MLDILARQVASPVQFVKGLHTLYDAGARVFVEVGPKRALQGFVADVLGDDAVLSLSTNHPKQGDVASFNRRCAACTPPASAPASARPQGAVLRGGATAQPRAATLTGASRARRRRRRGRAASRLGLDEAPTTSSGACSPSSSSAGARCSATATRTPARPASRSSSPARRSGSRGPSGSSTTPTSRACSTASSSST